MKRGEQKGSSGSREAAEGKQRVCRGNQRGRKDCSPSRPSVSPAIITFPEGGRVVNVGGGSGCHNIVILMCWPQGGPGTPHTHTHTESAVQGGAMTAACSALCEVNS